MSLDDVSIKKAFDELDAVSRVLFKLLQSASHSGQRATHAHEHQPCASRPQRAHRARLCLIRCLEKQGIC